MRMMMRIVVDTDAGNCTVKDGSMGRIVQESLERLSPEAAYFYLEDGRRAGLVVFNMTDTSQMPAVTEPLFQELGAKIWFTPIMSAEDLRKGLQDVFPSA